MSMMGEFKQFAMKGNVVDLAVGVIIGAAFGKIVDSLVQDIIMPPIARIVRRPRFRQLLHSAEPPGVAACRWRKRRSWARCWPTATS